LILIFDFLDNHPATLTAKQATAGTELPTVFAVVTEL
jgi:hypothetical protein